MTRYTKLERKRHVEASESFVVTPLMPANSVASKEASKPQPAPDTRKAKDADPNSEGQQNQRADGGNNKRKAEQNGEGQQSKKAKNKKKGNKEEARPKTEQEKSARSEKRRLRRQKERQNKAVCFVCRKTGHNAKDCKEAEGIGICYNCGSSEHTTATCKKLSKDGNKFKFATCFVCKEQGHLAGACPKNEKGLYPKGGSCRFCGKVDHLAKDCKLTKEEAGVVALGKIDLVQGADDDDYHIFVEEKRKMTEETKVIKKMVKEGPKKVKKVVSF
ncbi:hypothetical protein BGW41_004683 [Actinomortierella wolfii]|nr:hypothetical protein BGW41_004683 [Actinomortierella wolfii]